MRTSFSALAMIILFAGSATAYQPEAVAKPAKTASEDDVAELLTLLNETTSADTFVVILDTLVGLEPDRKGLIAAVIRNADRLGLLKGAASGRETPEQEAVYSALEKMIEARNEAKSRTTRSSPRPQPPAISVAPVNVNR